MNLPIEITERMNLLHEQEVVFEICEGCLYGGRKTFQYFE